jgi:hypothetical protein
MLKQVQHLMYEIYNWLVNYQELMYQQDLYLIEKGPVVEQ